MKVFLSWSGSTSRAVASALYDWLPMVLQAVQPWMSEESVPKGQQWSLLLQQELRETAACIICLTPENLEAPWLHFEAGQAARALDSAYICPYLVGVSKADLTGPLSLFQATAADQLETLRLVETINSTLGTNVLKTDLLRRTYEFMWPVLNARLGAIRETVVERKRPSSQVLEEILDTIRRMERVVTVDEVQNINNVLDAVQRIERTLVPADVAQRQLSVMPIVSRPLPAGCVVCGGDLGDWYTYDSSFPGYVHNSCQLTERAVSISSVDNTH
jgi:hypothetical protein